MDIDEMFSAIFDHASENDNFDTAFVEGLHEQYERNGRLTAKQVQALENIVDKYGLG